MSKPLQHVTELAVSTNVPMVDAFKQALFDALAGRGSLDESAYAIEGFCGKRFRLFLNNLIRGFDGAARYLEVGILQGATFCPAISNNAVKATGIDNWSWDKANINAPTFYRHLAKFKNPASSVTIIERDFHDVAASTLGKFNVYFYDGNHSEKDQYDAITWGADVLDATAIVLVDDWNWLAVRRGTMNALRDCKFDIDYMVELRTSFDDKLPELHGGRSDWHNGFFGAVVSRS